MENEKLAGEIAMTALVVAIYEVERDGAPFLNKLAHLLNEALKDRNASEYVRSRAVSWLEELRQGVDYLRA